MLKVVLTAPTLHGHGLSRKQCNFHPLTTTTPVTEKAVLALEQRSEENFCATHASTCDISERAHSSEGLKGLQQRRVGEYMYSRYVIEKCNYIDVITL